MKAYRTNAAYRSSDFYRGVPPSMSYAVNIRGKRNTGMRSLPKAPAKKTSIRVKRINA